MHSFGADFGVTGYWNDHPDFVFTPLTIAATWPAATNATMDADYEEIGPQVFRFEYYYMLTNGNLSVTSASGMRDVAAIVVDIAVIDPKSKVLLIDPQITTVAGQLKGVSTSAAPPAGAHAARTWR